jgi:predicted DNA-binding transcriptional regulator YafY
MAILLFVQCLLDLPIRGLLHQGSYTKKEIFKFLPEFYQEGPAGDRRLSRDIRALRELENVILVDKHTHVYSLRNKSFLDLRDEDIRALSVIRDTFEALAPISIDVLPVLEKVVSALPEERCHLYDRRAPISISLEPARDYRSSLGFIHLLSTAIEKQRKVRFVYPALDDGRPITHVGVEPYDIQFFDRQFYFVGFSPQASEFMEFRIDRLKELELMPGRTSRHRRRTTLQFTYHLSRRIVHMGISERFLNQQIDIQDDGSAIIQAEGYSEFRIIQNMLRYGEQAEIIHPPYLRERMKQVVKAMSVLYTSAQDK